MSPRTRISRWLDRHPFDIDQWLMGAVYTLAVLLALMLIGFLVDMGPFLIGLL